MKTEKGVSLIITFFIMLIILAVVLAITTILYSELKIIRNIGNSVVAFYAADSGAEKVLYYDRRVISEPGGEEQAVPKRGLCSMCETCPSEETPEFDTSIYCKKCIKTALDGPTGCDNAVCNNCQITFETSFSNKNYFVTATISPDREDADFSGFEIKSKGTYSDVSRQIDIKTEKAAIDAVVIESACANFRLIPGGEGQEDMYAIDILADVSSSLPECVINEVSATIAMQDYLDQQPVGHIFLFLNPDSGHWQNTWLTDAPGDYIVNLEAKNNNDPPDNQILNNVSSCDM